MSESLADWVLPHIINDTILIKGVKINLEKTDISKHIKMELIRGEYESEETEAINSHIMPDMTVIRIPGRRPRHGSLRRHQCFADTARRDLR